MSIARAEQLKKDLTDRYVVVADGVPELRRFSGLTGTVRTVNMNCRALVEFDGAVDISWYDIDPSFLHVVEAPIKKEKPATPAAAAPAKAAPAKAAAGGKSPLEMARAQAGAPATGEKKLSPLELARQQGASQPAAAAADSPKKLSPLELARQQGAKKAEPAAIGETPAPQSTAEPAAEAAPPPSAPAPAGDKPKTPAEIMAAIRANKKA